MSILVTINSKVGPDNHRRQVFKAELKRPGNVAHDRRSTMVVTVVVTPNFKGNSKDFLGEKDCYRR